MINTDRKFQLALLIRTQTSLSPHSSQYSLTVTYTHSCAALFFVVSEVDAVHAVPQYEAPDPLIGVVSSLGTDFDQVSGGPEVYLEPLAAVITARYPRAVPLPATHGVESALVGGVVTGPHGGSCETHVWQAVVLRSQRDVATG